MNDIDKSQGFEIYFGKYETLYLNTVYGYRCEMIKRISIGIEYAGLNKITELNKSARVKQIWVSGPSQAPTNNERAVKRHNEYYAITIGYKF